MSTYRVRPDFNCRELPAFSLELAAPSLRAVFPMPANHGMHTDLFNRGDQTGSVPAGRFRKARNHRAVSAEHRHPVRRRACRPQGHRVARP